VIETYIIEERCIMCKPCVLVVEDNNELRELYTFALARSGFEVMEAEDAKEALDLVKEEKPDVILTDIMMLNMDGIELIKCIKTDMKLADVPVIALSDCSDEGLKRANLAGVTKIIKKPIDPLALFDEVWKLLPVESGYVKMAA
jgi:two-component system, OmpR family, alkaline phosphatase synthesis response regulator PhoP